MDKNMRTMIRFMSWVVVAMIAQTEITLAQKVDEERMKRDIEVAENVLSTLIKQQFNNQRTFFPLEIKGSYQAGYGVTFSLPADFTTPIVFSTFQDDNAVTIWGNEPGMQSFNYSFEVEEQTDGGVSKASNNNYRLKDRSSERNRLNMDSIRDTYNQKVIDAAKTFIVDYGDMITQLGAQEKLIISNQGNQPRVWVNQFFNSPKRTHLSIELLKSDLALFKQGKLNREQTLAKVKVIDTETVETVDQDLELLSSIFSRLYRADLSKTFFTEDNIYYERLKDFGVIYYMQVISSIERGNRRFVMPTFGLDDVDLETRNKKIIQVYPKFESELKDNILEYGRTLKSLKDDEVLVFQVNVTRCPSCGIPSSVEYSVKGSVLKELNNGKLDAKAAASKVIVKRGPDQ